MKREDVLRSGTYPMLIGGKEVPSLSGKTFATIDPSNGRKLADVYEAGPEDVAAAVAAARKAFDEGWRSTLPRERSRKLLRLAELLAAKVEPLSWLECYDAGKPIAAVCHGPQLLITVNALRGRTATCWPSIAIDVKNAGGMYVDRPVVEDGPVITARKWDDVPAFSEAIVRAVRRDAAA